MHITVDHTKCQRYGQCVLEAPDVFALGKRGPAAVLPDAPESSLPQARAAEDLCPMQAITVTE